MAINPLIAMQGQPVDIGGAVQSGLNAYNAGVQNRLLQERQEMQKPLIELQARLAQQQVDSGNIEALNDEQKSVVQGSYVVKKFLDAGDIESARAYLQQRKADFSRYGLPTSHTDTGLQLLDQDPARLKAITDANVALGIKTGLLDSNTKSAYGTSATFFRDPASGKIVAAQGSQAGGFYANGQPVPANYEPIASPNTIYAQDAQNQRFYAGPTIAGQTRAVEANVDLQTKPQIAAEVTTAETTAKSGAEKQAQASSWSAFKSGFADAYPDIGKILDAAPQSSMSKVVSDYGAKVIGANSLNEAQAEIGQLGAILLQQVPFPPGAQSEAEMRQRAMTLGSLEDPNISPKKKLEMIDRFLKINERKFAEYAKEGKAASDTKPTQQTKTVVRTGTSNGRKVVQYSDGSIEYAD